jgi:putative SOS response-associated peptidase YedK
MCSHYEQVRKKEAMKRRFRVDVPTLYGKDDVWPLYEAMFIRRPREADMDTGDEAVPDREIELGRFGLIPHWAKDDKIGRQTFNARSETAHEKPSFRDAWKAARHCIIPADAIYEPDWRTGKAIPTRIAAADGEPLGIAGLWAWWKPPAGGPEVYSFTMLTINAAGHPIMQNMHKPDDEKRMVVILPPERYADWLTAPAADTREFLQLYPAELLVAEARPAPPRKAKEIPDA